ncbi:MAG: glycosyltransferase [Pseudomonadota bacterium]
MAFDRKKAPRVSIIMPAHNASAYIEEAVASIQAQSLKEWELIIVDDGSTDDTLAMATRWAAEDSRIRVSTQPNAGASAARNAGLEVAQATWVAFVDSDDWVHRDYLKKLIRPLARGRLDAAFCIAVDVSSDGTYAKRWVPAPHDNLFPVFATDCPIAVHSGVFRRAVIQEIGGWDTDLSTCEDWDLWMRFARTTEKVKNVMEELAFIRLRTGSLSRSMPSRLARDGAIVIERAVKPDPRVPNPLPRMANGLRSPDTDDRVAQHLIWAASLDIASGGDGKAILAAEPHRFSHPIDPADLAPTIWDAISHTTGEMDDDWSNYMTAVEELVAWLDDRNPTENLRQRTFQALELIIFQYAYLDEPIAFGGTYWATIDVEERVETVTVPDGLTQLAVVVFEGDERIGTIQMDVREGKVTASRLANALAQRFGGRLVYGRLRKRGRDALALVPHLLRAGLNRKVLRFAASFLQMTRHSQYDRAKALAISLGPDIAWESGLIKVDEDETEEDGPVEAEAREEVVEDGADDVFMPHDDEYGTSYWEEVFANQDPWDYSNNYEQTKYGQTIALLPERKFERALELACAEGHFTQILAPLVEELTATDISETALLRAKEACADHSNITYQQLDLKNGKIPGKFDLIVCSEVLYYFESRKSLAKIARKLADHLTPGGMILMAHGKIAVNAATETGFDWGHPFDARSIGDIFAKDPGLIIVEEAWSDIYGIQLFEAVTGKAKSPATPKVTQIERDPNLTYYVSSQIEWNGAAHYKKVEVSDELPILNFHRVTPDPVPAALAPYCHTPDQFEAQLQYFAQNGFYGVTLDEWQAQRARWRGMPGRALAITFDDGYVDFLEHALPILEKYGFPVTVFLVTDLVGKTAEWDARYGPPAPLMTWAQIKQAAEKGVQFGSHTTSHPLLTTLSPREVADQAHRSRSEIEQNLGQRVDSVAYPYGDFNEIVGRIFEDNGYTLGLDTSGDPAEIHDRPMAMGRIELLPADGPEKIASKIPTPRKTNQLRAMRLALKDGLFRARYNLL